MSLTRVERVLTFLNKLGIRKPVIQAPMAHLTTPTLVATVCNSGALGALPAAHLNSIQLKRQLKIIRELTHFPIMVNLYASLPENDTDKQKQLHHLSHDAQIQQRIQRAWSTLTPVRRHLSHTPAAATTTTTTANNTPPSVEQMISSLPTLHEQVKTLLEEEVPIVSFTNGLPSAEIMKMLKKERVIVMGTATSVAEAIAIEKAGCDAIIAQGFEAGGERATFLEPPPYIGSRIGTMTLVPALVDRVSIPVVASGGIMDGRGVVAAFALGAVAVQMGTAFIACMESGAHPMYKHALSRASDRDTVVTPVFTGRPGRALPNHLTQSTAQLDHLHDVAPYPFQDQLVQEIRQHDSQHLPPKHDGPLHHKRNDINLHNHTPLYPHVNVDRHPYKSAEADWQPMWAGQGCTLISDDSVHHHSAKSIISALGKSSLDTMREIEEVYQGIVRLRLPPGSKDKKRS